MNDKQKNGLSAFRKTYKDHTLHTINVRLSPMVSIESGSPTVTGYTATQLGHQDTHQLLLNYDPEGSNASHKGGAIYVAVTKPNEDHVDEIASGTVGVIYPDNFKLTSYPTWDIIGIWGYFIIDETLPIEDEYRCNIQFLAKISPQDQPTTFVGVVVTGDPALQQEGVWLTAAINYLPHDN